MQYMQSNKRQSSLIQSKLLLGAASKYEPGMAVIWASVELYSTLRAYVDAGSVIWHREMASKIRINFFLGKTTNQFTFSTEISSAMLKALYG